MKERWRWVPGYKGRYKVSDLGRVKSVTRVVVRLAGGFTRLQGRMLRQIDNHKRNYVKVVLSKNGKVKDCKVGRLVLEAFVGPCPPGMECCHYPDPETHNNALVNLRWDTSKANGEDMAKLGRSLRGSLCRLAKLTETEVQAMRKLHERTGQSHASIGERFGVTQQTASRILSRQTWRHC